MDYNETMKYITDTQKFGSNLGLERTFKILEILGSPHEKLRCIHVAGTNGKGSTTAMISKVLIECGYKVGMYTSPYLEEFEERIQINDRNIPKEDLADVVTKVSEAVKQVTALGLGSPTEFEIITCAMFLYFYIEKVDFAVIEVGLGGRLDSTNVIIPMVSVITSISYDHMKILGDTLEKIAYEKAGIIKKGIPVVTVPQECSAMKVIENTALQNSSAITKVPETSVIMKSRIPNAGMQNISVKTENDEYDIELSLIGKYQLMNCALAVHTLEVLKKLGVNIEKRNIISALKNVKWAGRLEILKRAPLTVIDGAHNIDGIKKLNESIEEYFSFKRLILLIGILADKQVDEMISEIALKADRIIAVAPHSSRAESPENLCKIIKKYNINSEYEDDYSKAYYKAKSYLGCDDMLLICGSLYMIGDMRKIIKNN